MTTRADVLILCKDCYEETCPTTIEGVEAITCDTEVFGNITSLRCKKCNNLVYTVIDHGVISFGEEEDE